MRERALIHVDGPADVGKTTFVERLLEAEVALALCVRAERDEELRQHQESAPKRHPELRRYAEAGACAVARWRFPAPRMDPFFLSEVMQEYSEAVLIEGDCPIPHVDLSVFVASVPPPGHSMLRRGARERAAVHRAAVEWFGRAVGNPEGLARFLGGRPGDASVARALEGGRRAPPGEHWALEDGYVGIERAQLVVVNLRSEADRGRAELLLGEVARLRQDDAVFQDILAPCGSRVPITAVVADLSNSRHPGVRRAVARVRRATQRRLP